MPEVGMWLPNLYLYNIANRHIIAYLQAMVIDRPLQEVRIVGQSYGFVSMWKVEVKLRFLPLDSPQYLLATPP